MSELTDRITSVLEEGVPGVSALISGGGPAASPAAGGLFGSTDTYDDPFRDDDEAPAPAVPFDDPFAAEDAGAVPAAAPSTGHPNPYYRISAVGSPYSDRPERREARPQRLAEDHQLHIVSLEAQNIKRLHAVRIEPDGSLVIIGGRNGQGKSSVLDSIMYALGGKGTLPGVPVRRGADGALIRLDLDGLIVERVFAADGTSQVKVTNGEGKAYGSPQAMLDKLYSSAAFDPLEFSRLKPKSQADRLKEVLGLDFTALDQERAKVYEDRLQTGRDLKKSEGTLATMPLWEDAPEAEVSLVELTAQLNSAQAANLTNAAARSRVPTLLHEGREIQRQIGDVQRQIADLQRREAELTEQLAAKTLAYREAQAKVADLQDEDLSALQAMVRETEARNRQVQDNARRALFAESVEQLRSEYDSYSARLAEIDTQKASLVASAPFPVEGLGFGPDGVTLHGLPFDQASSAEQLRVSVGMGLTLNHRLPILLIRDGSLLDADSLRMVGELAAEKGAQVWVERVSSGAEVSVVIEDGAVVGAAPEASW